MRSESKNCDHDYDGFSGSVERRGNRDFIYRQFFYFGEGIVVGDMCQIPKVVNRESML